MKWAEFVLDELINPNKMSGAVFLALAGHSGGMASLYDYHTAGHAVQPDYGHLGKKAG